MPTITEGCAVGATEPTAAAAATRTGANKAATNHGMADWVKLVDMFMKLQESMQQQQKQQMEMQLQQQAVHMHLMQ